MELVEVKPNSDEAAQIKKYAQPLKGILKNLDEDARDDQHRHAMIVTASQDRGIDVLMDEHKEEDITTVEQLLAIVPSLEFHKLELEYCTGALTPIMVKFGDSPVIPFEGSLKNILNIQRIARLLVEPSETRITTLDLSCMSQHMSMSHILMLFHDW